MKTFEQLLEDVDNEILSVQDRLGNRRAVRPRRNTQRQTQQEPQAEPSREAPVTVTRTRPTFKADPDVAMKNMRADFEDKLDSQEKSRLPNKRIARGKDVATGIDYLGTDKNIKPGLLASSLADKFQNFDDDITDDDFKAQKVKQLERLSKLMKYDPKNLDKDQFERLSSIVNYKQQNKYGTDVEYSRLDDRMLDMAENYKMDLTDDRVRDFFNTLSRDTDYEEDDIYDDINSGLDRIDLNDETTKKFLANIAGAFKRNEYSQFDIMKRMMEGIRYVDDQDKNEEEKFSDLVKQYLDKIDEEDYSGHALNMLQDDPLGSILYNIGDGDTDSMFDQYLDYDKIDMMREGGIPYHEELGMRILDRYVSIENLGTKPLISVMLNLMKEDEFDGHEYGTGLYLLSRSEHFGEFLKNMAFNENIEGNAEEVETAIFEMLNDDDLRNMEYDLSDLSDYALDRALDNVDPSAPSFTRLYDNIQDEIEEEREEEPQRWSQRGDHTIFDFSMSGWNTDDVADVESLDDDLKKAGLTRDDLVNQIYIEWREQVNREKILEKWKERYPNNPGLDRDGSLRPELVNFGSQIAAFDALKGWREALENDPEFEPGTILYNTPAGGGIGGNMREVLYNKMGFGKDDGRQFGVIGMDGKVYPINDYTDEEKEEMKKKRQEARAERNKDKKSKGIGDRISAMAQRIDDRVRTAAPETNDRLDRKTAGSRSAMARNLQSMNPTRDDRIRFMRDNNIRYQGMGQPYIDDEGNEYTIRGNQVYDSQGRPLVGRRTALDKRPEI